MRGRILPGLLAAIALAGSGLLWASHRGDLPARVAGQRPELLLLTSLPLMFAERFGLDQPGSPALARIEQRYRVVPIAVADRPSLAGHRLLLLAQPRAQPADALVELDGWVRGGGRLVLLADPSLEWPSKKPLGDLSRPQPAYADTGLLAHWGLTLLLPGDGESAGRLTASVPTCTLAARGLIAHCRVGRGRVTVIADADFLNVAAADDRALDPLMQELASFESR